MYVRWRREGQVWEIPEPTTVASRSSAASKLLTGLPPSCADICAVEDGYTWESRPHVITSSSHHRKMPDISFRPLLELNFAEMANLFNRCFEGYVIPFTMTAQNAAAHSRKDGIDHIRSFVAVKDGQDIGLAYIAPRFETARLAGMGIVKSARGQGTGRVLVAEFLRRLREEGFREAVLEVFEQNEAAVRLYKSFGFEATQRLYGFEREPMRIAEAKPLRQVSLGEFSDAMRISQLPSSPTANHFCRTTLPVRAWTIDGQAYAIYAPPRNGGLISLGGFFVTLESRGKGMARQLFQSIQAANPQRSWFLGQVFPEATAPFLEHLGFKRMELNQFEMKLKL
jgi:GNAT superfamily N-acetyltransferase